MPAMWYSRINPEDYHVRWCCDRLELMVNRHRRGRYIAEDEIGEEMTVTINRREYELELCGRCQEILDIEAQYDDC